MGTRPRVQQTSHLVKLTLPDFISYVTRITSGFTIWSGLEKHQKSIKIISHIRPDSTHTPKYNKSLPNIVYAY